MRRAASVLALAMLALPALAQDAPVPVLGLPADCDLGRACYFQQYVDHDPGPEARDFTCNRLSYDDHKGTDLALPDLAAMEAGVRVIAVAPGTVRGVRNDVADIPYTPERAGAVRGRDCGNGVVIDHGDGWETQYCHLRKGSVAVATGDRVARGAHLGVIGLSGRTQFPHVHLSVRHNGAVVDPFNPDGGTDCARPPSETLWQTPYAYRPGGLISAGVSAGVPEFAAIRAGTAARMTLPPESDALVAWGFAFGGRPGDILRVSIAGPGRMQFTQEFELDRHQIQLFRAAGKRAPKSGWAKGRYTARIEMHRDGALLDSLDTRVTVE